MKGFARTLVTLDAEADVDVPLQHLDLEVANISDAVTITLRLLPPSVTYRPRHPWTAVKIPGRFGAHRIAKDGAHVLTLAQLAEHTAHRGAGKAL